MNLKLLSILMVVPILGVTGTAAQAANYVEISGANVDFFIDSQVWDPAAITVTGNNLSIALDDEYSVNANVKAANGTADNPFHDFENAAVVAVAHQGYSLTNNVTQSVAGNYTLAPQSGRVSYTFESDVNSGQYSAGTFSFIAAQKTLSTSAVVSSSNFGKTGIFADKHGERYDSGTTAGALVGALGIDIRSMVEAAASGPGKNNATLSVLEYGFNVSAVPEPETYGMMLAGLGLMGLVAFRRKVAGAA